MHFGDNIKTLRKRRGWSRDQVAEKLEVTPTTITGWEIGRSYPHFQVLLKLRGLFEVDLESLVYKDLKEEGSMGYENLVSKEVLGMIEDLKSRVDSLEQEIKKLKAG